MKSEKGISGAGLAIGLGLVIIALGIVWNAFTLRVMPNGSDIGPHVFPLIIAGGMILCGAAVLKTSLTSAHALPLNVDDGPTDWRALGLIVAALLGMAFLLPWLGFIVCATGLFVATACAFGSRKTGRDLLVGAIVVGLTWYVFTQGLGLQLPTGWIFEYLGRMV